MRYIGLFLLILLTCSGGCGYRLADTDRSLAGDVQRVYVPIFKNATYEPFLENLLSDEVVRELGRRQGVRTVDSAAAADAILSGRVIGYRNRAVGYDADDEVAEYRVVIQVEVQLKRIDTGEIVWKGRLSRHDEYLADANAIEQLDRERAVQQVVARLLAEDLYVHLAEGF